jgi:hypothetical protein
MIAIGLLCATASWATTILVDTFDATNQFFSVAPGGTNPASASDGVSAVEAIGGFRQLDLLRTSGSGRVEASTGPDGFPPQTLSLSLSTGTAGSLTATWDAQGAGLGLDLTGTTNFFLQAISDLGMAGTITIYTGTNSSSAAFQIVADPSAFSLPTIIVPFTSFVAGPQGGVDFANVSRIVLELDATNSADAYLDSVGFGAIPESATLLLAVGGIALLGILRRRLGKA